MLGKQIVRFVITGIINTIVGYGLYALFIYVGLQYIIAITLSTILGILFNFKTIGKFVFESDDNKLLMKFILSYFVTFIVNVWTVSKLILLGYDYYSAGFVAIVLSSILSFILTKYLVFKK